MAHYSIELRYVTSIVEHVEAKDEGEAYELARRKAEEADMRDFNIVEEIESQIIECR